MQVDFSALVKRMQDNQNISEWLKIPSQYVVHIVFHFFFVLNPFCLQKKKTSDLINKNATKSAQIQVDFPFCIISTVSQASNANRNQPVAQKKQPPITAKQKATILQPSNQPVVVVGDTNEKDLDDLLSKKSHKNESIQSQLNLQNTATTKTEELENWLDSVI